MTDDNDALNNFERLRREAENRIQKQGPKRFEPPEDVLEIIHELEIHQAELEIQNDALRQAMRELETVGEEYARLYEAAPVGFLNLDQNGRITKANAAAVKFFRTPRHFLIGRNFSTMAHSEDISIVIKALEKNWGRCDDVAPEAFEVRFIRKELSFVYARLEIIPDVDPRGRFTGWRAAVIDITRQKNAENALRRSHGELEARVTARTSELRKKNRSLERFTEELEKERDQRRYLAKKLVETLEKERREMAAALHDEVGHLLTRIKMDIDRVKENVDAPCAAVISDLEAIQERIGGAMDFIHNLSRSLRPSVLDDLGLVPALSAVCDEINARHALECRLFTKDVPEEMDEDKALAVYRIVQEAAVNCLKYARATQLFVTLTRKEGRLLLTIEDDGVGFDYADLSVGPDTKGKLGIMIMNERAVQAGGEFHIESQVGAGTQILVEVPL